MLLLKGKKPKQTKKTTTQNKTNPNKQQQKNPPKMGELSSK